MNGVGDGGQVYDRSIAPASAPNFLIDIPETQDLVGFRPSL